MKVAEVVEAAYQAHAGGQSLSLMGQMASAARQGTDRLAKGGSEAFDESGIDHAFSLCRLDQPFHQVFRTLRNAPLHVQDAFHALFDDLHNGDVLPGHHLAPSRFALGARVLAPSR